MGWSSLQHTCDIVSIQGGPRAIKILQSSKSCNTYICLSQAGQILNLTPKPKPPHSAVFGHWLLLLGQWVDYPWDSFFANILDGIQRKFDLPPIFFLDLWPIFPPIVCVSDPDVARKITVEDRAPRWPSVFEPLAPAASQRWIQTLSQNNWTKNHSIFGSSFTTSRFVRMIPAMAEDLQALDQMLAQCAKTGQIFKMATVTKFSILEMTGRVLFGRQLDTFSENSEWSALYEGAVGSISAARNPFKRPFIMQKWRTRCEAFHKLIRNEVYACFRERDSHSCSKPSLLYSSFTAYQNNKLPQFPVNIGGNGQMTEEYVDDLVSRSAAEKAPLDVTNMTYCSCAGIFLAAVSGSTSLSVSIILLHAFRQLYKPIY